MTKNGEPKVLSASTLNGTDVINTEGEDIGEIKELMIDLDYGRVSYAVLQFGGIMGLGDKLFAIPWDALTLDVDDNKFVLNIEKEVLENAEGFDQNDWPESPNYKWMTDTYEYYGYDPYWS